MMRRRAVIEAVAVAALVTGIVTATSMWVPEKYIATAVGFVFLGATWLFVWRRDDGLVEAAGLALGGIVLPGKLDMPRLARSIVIAVGWALLLGAIFFVPFFFGWRHYWHAHGTFSFHAKRLDFANDTFGQLVIIALPEEAFYRGYVQSRLDQAFPQRLRILGADVGPSLVITSIIFALGHLATIHEPTRLAVFFPSLVFGWLRYRTRGIGAGLTFHALCNVFSEVLGRGYHLYS